MTGLIERHQDYVLGPNQDSRLASVAAGQTIEGIKLKLDSDAPFALRSRAVRVFSDTLGPRAVPLNHLLLRWAGPDRNYQSQDFIRQTLLGPYLGQFGNPLPVFPQVVYPKGSEITVDLRNDSIGDTLTNLTLYFRGVKLFAPGAVKSYEYPANIGLLPFAYPIGQYSDTDGLTLVRSVAVTQGPLRQTFKVKGDADYVIRGGQCDLAFAAGGNPVYEVFVTLRDEDEKPYSNDAVHVNILFGNSAGTLRAECGPNSPGLFYPEIYVPKNHLMYLDVTRDDVLFQGAVAADVAMNFTGQKVFQK